MASSIPHPHNRLEIYESIHKYENYSVDFDNFGTIVIKKIGISGDGRKDSARFFFFINLSDVHNSSGLKIGTSKKPRHVEEKTP